MKKTLELLKTIAAFVLSIIATVLLVDYFNKKKTTPIEKPVDVIPNDHVENLNNDIKEINNEVDNSSRDDLINLTNSNYK